MKLSHLLLVILQTAVDCHGGHTKLAALGEICGGPITPSIQCQEGLECYYPTGIHDLPGTCRSITSMKPATASVKNSKLETSVPRIAGKDEHCGGFIMNAPVCANGLTCVLFNIPDVGGTCQ